MDVDCDGLDYKCKVCTLLSDLTVSLKRDIATNSYPLFFFFSSGQSRWSAKHQLRCSGGLRGAFHCHSGQICYYLRERSARQQHWSRHLVRFGILHFCLRKVHYLMHPILVATVKCSTVSSATLMATALRSSERLRG